MELRSTLGVTSLDTTTKTYTINVGRPGSGENHLIGIKMTHDAGVRIREYIPHLDRTVTFWSANPDPPIEQFADRNVTEYTVAVPSAATEFAIIIPNRVDSQFSTVRMDDQSYPVQPFTLTLNDAGTPTPIEFVVTAQNGDEETYTITVNRPAATAAASLSEDATSGGAFGVTNLGRAQIASSRLAPARSSAVPFFNPAVDTTPPEVFVEVFGTLGLNGWHTDDVTVIWSGSDPESPITDVSPGCVLLTLFDDTTPEGVTLTCTLISAGGSTTRSVTIRRDSTTPVVLATVLKGGLPINEAVWSDQDLTVRFTCVEEGSGLATTCPLDSEVTTDGTNTLVSGPICDLAGNCASASVTARIDRTGPVLTIPASLNVTTSGGDKVVAFSATASDALSGVTGEVWCDPASGSIFPVGTTQVTCTIRDLALNITSDSFDVNVEFIPPPRLNGVPGNITTAVETSDGAVVSYALPTASDGSTVTCAPASGSTFLPGTTQVSCTTGTGLSASFLVTVRDPDAPVLNGLPGTIIAEAESAAGAAVSYASPTAEDSGGASAPVECEPASGSTFPLGTNTVVCEATGAVLTASAGFLVIVQDTTAPGLTNPDDIEQEGNTTGGANVTLSASTATDIVDPAPGVSCDQESGFFPLGKTTVICTATDSSNNQSQGSYTVTVADTTAPDITAPPDTTVVTNVAGGYTGSFGAPTVSDIVDGSPSVGNDAPALLSMGTTVVTWTATDASNNSATVSHTVTVIPVTLTVDIKPGDDPNPLNLNGNGVLPVAVLGTDTVNVHDIVVTSLRFGVGGTEEEVVHRGHIEDVNGDDVDDLVIHFRKTGLGIPIDTAGGTLVTLTLTGQFNDGRDLEGQDEVLITPSNEKGRDKGGKGPK